MRFVTRSELAEFFRGKAVALVGSGPSVLQNEPEYVDSHSVVCRVNNYGLSAAAGRRTDVYYSFFGGSIRKTAEELQRDGVRLCVAKCPNSLPLESEWHRERGKLNGIDFRYIYDLRKDWWFCDTYIPDDAAYLAKCALLSGHVPTTGFSAILDILACEPASLYLTGYDFFDSGLHNVDQRWRPGDPSDPLGHRPEMEKAWLRQNLKRYPIRLDQSLRLALTISPSITAEADIPVS